MSDPKREELKVKKKRAILTGLISRDWKYEKEQALDEIRGLAKTAGCEIVGEIYQFRDTPHPGTCLGPGKVEELKELAISKDAEVIIFDNNLTPAQGRNLEEATEMIIVDRSEVILDIFASTARTHESQLQVELAQLLYFRPRLKRLWTHLERIEGGVGAGRGPGEKQLETDRRLIDKRISELKKKIKEIQKRKERTVAQRSGFKTVSLVGYTNAGKSTLMKAFTGEEVYIADKLFATLDTKTRKWTLPQWGDILLSDTVGFVRNLPHHLVASFKSTLEEARHADLLLHVVDASDPEADSHIETVDKVLKDIGVDCAERILVLNKIDACPDRTPIDILRRHNQNAISVSAVDGTGLETLTGIIAEKLSGGFVDVLIETNVGNGKLFSFLEKHSEVKSREYDDTSRVEIRCVIPRTFIERMKYDDTSIQILEEQSSESTCYSSGSARIDGESS